MSETERPEGAIPTAVDSPEQAPQQVEDTMISEADVQGALAEIEDAIGEGEPLPVGANDPEVLADAPVDPPGMPHQPDDLDREMAQYVQDYHDGHGAAAHLNADRVRPDQASVLDAEHEVIEEQIKPRNVRQALLVHAQQMARAQRQAALDYGRALMVVQESRDAFVAARDALGGAEEALFAMGLDTEADHPKAEPQEVAEQPRIDDSQIV